MTPLIVILGTIGAVLILVGLVGGGFTLSNIDMPRVSNLVRLPCFVVGILMVVTAVGLGISISQPDQEKGRTVSDKIDATIVAQPGYVVRIHQAPSLSSEIVGTLPNGAHVKIQCTVQGDVVTENGTSSGLWDYIGSGYLPEGDIYTGTSQSVIPSCS